MDLNELKASKTLTDGTWTRAGTSWGSLAANSYPHWSHESISYQPMWKFAYDGTAYAIKPTGWVDCTVPITASGKAECDVCNEQFWTDGVQRECDGCVAMRDAMPF